MINDLQKDGGVGGVRADRDRAGRRGA
jgi:hypothetical protein